MLGAEVTLKLDSQIARSLLDYRTVVAAGRLDAAESRGQELRSLVLKRDYTYSGTEDLSGTAAGTEKPVENPAVSGC